MMQARADAEGSKFLSFILAGEFYGIPLLMVREIIGFMKITPIPQTPDHFQGVINLRGEILPVIDLRLKLDMEASAPSTETCIIIVAVTEQKVGLIVDRVASVQTVASAEIQTPPTIDSQIDSHCVMGLGRQGDTVTILLAMERLLPERELASLPKAAPGDPTAA